MKFFNLQVSKPGGEEPDDVLRLADADGGGPGFLAQPGGELKGRQKPGGLGRANAGRSLELGGGTGGQLPKRTIRNAEESRRQLERGLGTGPGAEDDGKQLDRGQRPGAKRPEAFPRAITIGEGGKGSRHPRS